MLPSSPKARKKQESDFSVRLETLFREIAGLNIGFALESEGEVNRTKVREFVEWIDGKRDKNFEACIFNYLSRERLPRFDEIARILRGITEKLNEAELHVYIVPILNYITGISETLDLSSELRNLGNKDEFIAIESTSRDGIKWIKRKIYDLTDEEQERIDEALKFLTDNLAGKSLEEQHLTHDDLSSYASNFRRALWSNAITITHVPEATLKCEKLRAILQAQPHIKFHELCVIKTPRVGSSDHFIEQNVILTELVAVAAANFIINRPTKNRLTGVIGVGGGYTMERLAFNSRPVADDETLIWLPVQVFAQPEDYKWGEDEITIPSLSKLAFNAEARSANGIAMLLSSIHPHSNALHFPFTTLRRRDIANLVGEDEGEAEKLYRDYNNRKDGAIKHIQAIIMGVGGIAAAEEFRYSDGEHASSSVLDLLHQHYQEDLSKGKVDQGSSGISNRDDQPHDPVVVGELLGYLINKNGRPAGDKNIEKLNESINHSIELPTLRQLVKANKRVWLVAAGGTDAKRKSVHAAIDNGLANALVIDEDIADYLLAQYLDARASSRES